MSILHLYSSSGTIKCSLPPVIYNAPRITSPDPYYRTHIIKSNPQIAKSLIDTLNSKPYRFGFTIDRLRFLVKNNKVQIWKPTISSKVDVRKYNDSELEKLIKQPLFNPFTVITYLQHIHETPVPIPDKLDILSNNNGLIVIDKPSGIPVHGVQKYYYNTIHAILSKQLGIDQDGLFPIHRLDKLTSGVLIWATDSETVAKFKDNYSWDKKKVYLARIKGRLSDEEVESRDDLVYLYPSRQMIRVYKGTKTVFNELFYDRLRNESIVSARLRTGFPHQIRIHLRNMGIPIVDDPLYGPTGKYSEITRTKKDINEEYWKLILDRTKTIEQSKMSVGELPCPECASPIFNVPDKHVPGEYAICLHAWKYEYLGKLGGPYESENHSFQSPIPAWAIPSVDNKEEVIMKRLREIV